jgi:hypothetical protein
MKIKFKISEINPEKKKKNQTNIGLKSAPISGCDFQMASKRYNMDQLPCTEVK